MKPHETQIQQLLQQGDKKAMALIYDHFGAAVYGVVLRICQNDEAVARDALQEGLVNVWKNAKSYDSGKGTLFTWIMNICRNKALDKYRQQKRKQEIQTNSANVNIHEARVKTATNVDTIGLREEVDKLPKEQRELIELAYFQGYAQSEISEHLDLPLGTVKTRVRNALLNLRKVYKE